MEGGENMLKKAMSFVLALCLLFVLMTGTLYAAEITAVNPGNGLHYAYSKSFSAELKISKDGIASATGEVYGIPGITTKTTVHLYLQRYKDGKWEDVDDWLSTGETVNRSLTKTKQVTKGYKYRAKASCYAYSGTKYEHVTKYSGTVSY